MFINFIKIFLLLGYVNAKCWDNYLLNDLDEETSPCDDFYGHVCRWFPRAESLHNKYVEEFMRIRDEFLDANREDSIVKEIESYKNAETVFTSNLLYDEIISIMRLEDLDLDSQLKYVSSIADPLRLMFPAMLQSLSIHNAHRKSDDEKKSDIVRIVNFVDKSTFEDCSAEYVTLMMRPLLQRFFMNQFEDAADLKSTFERVRHLFYTIKRLLIERIERSSSLMKRREYVMKAVDLAFPVIDFDTIYLASRAFTFIGERIQEAYEVWKQKNENATWLQKKLALLRCSYQIGHSTQNSSMNVETILSGSWSNPVNVELVYTARPGEGMIIIPAGSILAVRQMDGTEMMGYLGPKIGHSIAHTSTQYNAVTASRNPDLRGRIGAIKHHFRKMCSNFAPDSCNWYSEKDDLADFEGLFDVQEWYFGMEDAKMSEGNSALTNKQRFFYSMALGHCGDTGHVLWHSPVRARQVSADIVRINSLVSLNRYFRETFECPIGSRLFPGAHGLRPIFG